VRPTAKCAKQGRRETCADLRQGESFACPKSAPMKKTKTPPAPFERGSRRGSRRRCVERGGHSTMLCFAIGMPAPTPLVGALF
jgi:hypothetical protein